MTGDDEERLRPAPASAVPDESPAIPPAEPGCGLPDESVRRVPDETLRESPDEMLNARPSALPDEMLNASPSALPHATLDASPSALPDETADAAELQLGRMLMRTNLWRIGWVAVVVSVMQAGAPGMNLLPMIARLALIGLAALLVYRGMRWALWLLGSLTVLAGAGMVIVAVAMAELDWTIRVLFAVAGAAQVFSFLVLAKAPEVRAFMTAQRTAAQREKQGRG